jgi:hypothetical protein
LETVSAYPEAFWLWIVSICVHLRFNGVLFAFIRVHSRLIVSSSGSGQLVDVRNDTEPRLHTREGRLDV